MRDQRPLAVLAAALGALAIGCDNAPRVTNPALKALVAFTAVTEVEPNNTCPTAQDLGLVALPLTVSGSLDTIPPATTDLDFFRFKGTPGDTVTIDLEGQSTGKGTLFDPLLGVFNSGCGMIATANNGGVGLNARLTLTIPLDSILIVAATSCCDTTFTQGGLGSYQLTVQRPPQPGVANDFFANATGIGGLPFSDVVDNSGATAEPGEPTPFCFFGSTGKSVWYRFTPTETRAITASVSAPFSTVVAAYTGGSVTALTPVACGVFGQGTSFLATAGTTYSFQVDGLFGQAGQLVFRLDVAPPPIAQFNFFPFDPSVFDVVQFQSFSFDPAGIGFGSQAWSFGDGAVATGCCVAHQYAADTDYTVRLTVTTIDGRTASTSQPVHVRTHDVAITRLAAPNAASSGQTRRIVVSVNSRRYDETVQVQLFRSVPGGVQQFGALTQFVPMNPKNGTTEFAFSYTFTGDDAQIGKVTFSALASIIGARDALPADNQAVAPPTKVGR